MITDDPNNPDLAVVDPVTGMQKAYLALSAEERSKGFVRPYRTAYTHVGKRPKYPLRPLTDEEKERHATAFYKPVAYEEYPESETLEGHYWTLEALQGGCGTLTVMARALAETYARDPKFYGGTYCAGCGRHFPVSEFAWVDGEPVGS